MRRWRVLVSFFLLAALSAPAQIIRPRSDTLLRLLRNAKDDTSRTALLYSLGEYYYTSVPDSGLYYWKACVTAATSAESKTNNREVKRVLQQHRASATSSIGVIYRKNGEYDAALSQYAAARLIYESLKDSAGIAETMSSSAVIFRKRGDIAKAIRLNEEALNIRLKKGDKNAAYNYLNLGVIYEQLGDVPKSIDYYNKCIRLLEEAGNKAGIAHICNVISLAYANQGEPEKALAYLNRAYRLSKETNNVSEEALSLEYYSKIYCLRKKYREALPYLDSALKKMYALKDMANVSSVLSELGEVHCYLKDTAQAIEYYRRALVLEEKFGQKAAQALTMIKIAAVFYNRREMERAIDFAESSLAIAQDLKHIHATAEASGLLTKIYAAAGDYKKAFAMQELFLAMHDSLNSQSGKQAALKQRMQYEFDKQEALNSEINKRKDEEHAAESRQQTFILIATLAGLLLVIGFSFALYRRFRTTREQKNIIEQQKVMVEVKNREITDSIMYARRIQEAQLPAERQLNKVFTSAFVFFRPKDIVSGDFFWFTEKNNRLLLAVADCTGHGVPGALMSVMGASLLTEIVGEKGVLQPDQALDTLRQRVVSSMLRSGGETLQRDGMDMALCNIDPAALQLEAACANNPVLLLRNGEVTIIGPDKFPVGIHYSDELLPFTLHRVKLEKGDMLYLFSDGFADQFGGPKGKKFKFRQLEMLLTEISGLRTEEQKHRLETTFDTWKGDLEQTDDVCIIGVKI